MALISTVLADFIFLLAEAIQQKPVIPAYRGAEITGFYCIGPITVKNETFHCLQKDT